MNYSKFFGRNAKEVAVDLLGRLLVRNTEKGSTGGKIIEVGAYEGGSETSTKVGMKYSPGKVFLMSYRGKDLFNIATDKEGYLSCVEIRKIAFHHNVLEGSGIISDFLNVDRSLDGILLGREIEILGEAIDKSKVGRKDGDSGNCLGYFLIKK